MREPTEGDPNGSDEMTDAVTVDAAVSRRAFAWVVGVGGAAFVAGTLAGMEPAGATASGAWSLTGNAGTTPGTNFIGTTDAQSVVMKTNATERLRLTSAGPIGVNLTAPTAQLHANSTTGSALRGDTSAAKGAGVRGVNTSGQPIGKGVAGSVTNVGYGVYGSAGSGFGVYGIAANSNGAGVGGDGASGGLGVIGTVPDSGDGVRGTAGIGNGVSGIAANGNGVLGTATTGTGVGVRGVGPSGGHGVFGSVPNSGYGVYGVASVGEGVRGVASSGDGVHGEATTGSGVYGKATAANGTGVVGFNPAAGGIGTSGYGGGAGGIGVAGTAISGGIAVRGATAGQGYGIYGTVATDGIGVYGTCGNGGLAARFDGSVLANGVLYVGGSPATNNTFLDSVSVNADTVNCGTLNASTKHFRIDHPQDPANKYLTHSCVESAERLNVYSGDVTLDDTGRAIVVLPSYFHALNASPRVQLTGVGRGHVFVEEDVRDGTFAIGGDPGQKVYWQLSGVRQDAYALAHPLEVETDKAPRERGHFLTPEVHGAGPERSIRALHHRTRG